MKAKIQESVISSKFAEISLEFGNFVFDCSEAVGASMQ